MHVSAGRDPESVRFRKKRGCCPEMSRGEGFEEARRPSLKTVAGPGAVGQSGGEVGVLCPPKRSSGSGLPLEGPRKLSFIPLA